MPEPNGGFLSGVSGGKIHILGGTNWAGGVKNWLQAIHSYDPAARKWERLGSLDSPVAYGLSGATAEGAIVFGAGFTGKEAWGGIGILREGKVAPSEVRHHHPATALAAGGVWQRQLVIVGGASDVADLSTLSVAAIAIDCQTGERERLLDYPGKAFGTAASAIAGGTLFIFGGANWDAAAKAVVNTRDAFALDLERKAWRALAPLPAAVRGLSAALLDDGHLYLAGGYRSDPEGFTAGAWVYDIGANRYERAQPLPVPGMCGLIVCGDHLYCMGGEDKMKSRTDRVFRIRVAHLLP
jgi:N-acetylneuraminic acid mutarotase